MFEKCRIKSFNLAFAELHIPGLSRRSDDHGCDLKHYRHRLSTSSVFLPKSDEGHTENTNTITYLLETHPFQRLRGHLFCWNKSRCKNIEKQYKEESEGKERLQPRVWFSQGELPSPGHANNIIAMICKKFEIMVSVTMHVVVKLRQQLLCHLLGRRSSSIFNMRPGQQR